MSGEKSDAVAFLALNEYKSKVSDVGIEDEFLRPGAFYSCYYNFIPQNRGVPFDVTKWYDFFPLIYVIDRKETKSGDLIITAINFHHVPRSIRTEWFENMKTSYGDIFNETTRYILLPPQQIILRQRKLYYAIRNYTEERMIHPVRIPNSKVQELADINSRTHYGVGPIGISNRIRRKPLPTNIINNRKKRK